MNRMAAMRQCLGAMVSPKLLLKPGYIPSAYADGCIADHAQVEENSAVVYDKASLAAEVMLPLNVGDSSAEAILQSLLAEATMRTFQTEDVVSVHCMLCASPVCWDGKAVGIGVLQLLTLSVGG